MFATRTFLSCLVGAVSLHVSAQNQPLVIQSAQRQTALLELFTSEGCSSCPPAEAWLSGLKTSPRLWRDFVPVAFHVDYWDSPGWRDPWSSQVFSDRQRTYAQSWRRDSVYTPGFVLDAKEWSAAEAPKTGPRSSSALTGVLGITSKDLEHWQVSFAPVADREGHYEVVAALLANGLSSDVKAGENQGRHLKHDFVVTSLSKALLKLRNNRAEGEISLAAAGAARTNRLAIAAWVTRVGDPEPLQAAGGWLPGRNSASTPVVPGP